MSERRGWSRAAPRPRYRLAPLSEGKATHYRLTRIRIVRRDPHWQTRRQSGPRWIPYVPGRKFVLQFGTNTPVLKRSWGFVGISANSTDTCNNLKIGLEASGTPAAVAVGDLILVAVSWPNTNSLTVSDDGANTWASAIGGAVTSSTGQRFDIQYTLATAYASKITLGFGSLIKNITFQVSIFSNVATSSPLDGSATTTDFTPTVNTNPNIQSGSLTTTVDGDLIYTVVFQDATTLGLLNTVASVSFGSGCTGLAADTANVAANGNAYGTCAQFQVQTTHGAINPGLLISQTTHDVFSCLSVAIKPGSGGSAPGSGMYIRKSQMAYINSTTTFAIPFPSAGNLVAVLNDATTGANTINSVTDGNSNTYTQVPAGTSTAQIILAPAASTGNTLVVSLHNTNNGGTSLVGIFDIVGAHTAPIDTAAAAANSSTLTANNSGSTVNAVTESSTTVSDLPSVIPSTSNGLILVTGACGTGPITGLTSSGSYDYITATFQAGAGAGDSNALCNGDLMCHYFNPSTATVDFTFTVVNNGASISGVCIVLRAATAATTITHTYHGGSLGGAHNGTSIAVPCTAQIGESVIIFFACTAASTGISSISDGTANVYTKGPVQTTNVRTEIWYSLNIANAVASTATVTYSGVEAAACCETYAGVSAVGNTGSNSGSSTAPSVTVTAQRNGSWIIMCGGDTALISTSSWTAGLPNQLWHSVSSLSSTGGAISAASADGGPETAGPGSVTVTATLSVTETWGAVGLELIPAISPGDWPKSLQGPSFAI